MRLWSVLVTVSLSRDITIITSLAYVTGCYIPSTVLQRQQLKLEGTHRVRTHAMLLLTLTLTLTFDLSTQNHVTCRISQGHSLYQVWTLYGMIIRFWVMLRTLVWKMHLLTLWPWPLTFQPQTMCLLQDIPRSLPVRNLNTLGSFVFWVMLRTNRQTDGHERHTHTDQHSRRAQRQPTRDFQFAAKPRRVSYTDTPNTYKNLNKNCFETKIRDWVVTW